MAKVSYTPNVWKDKTISFQGSIIDATTMNNIEKGIVDVSNAINDLYVNGSNGIQGP